MVVAANFDHKAHRRQIPLPQGDVKLVDRLSGRTYQARGEVLEVELPAHGTLMLEIVGKADPTAITTEKGWLVLDAPKTYERLGDAHLFEIALGAGETKVVEIAEATPLTRTLDLAQPTTLDMMKVFVDSPHPTPELKKQLQDLLAIHREVIDTDEKIANLRDRAAEYRLRMDELNDQIISLKKVKTATSLSRNLQDKMKDISDRVQKTTIDIVDNQEKLMLAKVRFQDALAELTLPDAAAHLAVTTP